MKISKNVLIIGHVEFIVYSTPRSKEKKSLNFYVKNQDMLLAVNSTHTALFIFPNCAEGKKKIVKDKKGTQRGFIHTKMKYEVPTLDLKTVGVLNSIQYRTEWWGAEGATLEHFFEVPPKLSADRYNRFNVMGIKPTKGKIIDDRGISG